MQCMFKRVGSVCFIFGFLFSVSAENLIKNGGFDRDFSSPVVEVPCSALSGIWQTPRMNSRACGWRWFRGDGDSYLGGYADAPGCRNHSVRPATQLVPSTGSIKTGLLTFRYKLGRIPNSNYGNTILGSRLRVVVFGVDDDSKPYSFIHRKGKENTFPELFVEEMDSTDGMWVDVKRTVHLNGEYPDVLVSFSGAGETGKLALDDISFTPTEWVSGEGPSPSVQVPVLTQPVKKAPAPVGKAVPVFTPPVSRPAPVVLGPVVTTPELIRAGDFSTASLALVAAEGSLSSELSTCWLRSKSHPWKIMDTGGNLGAHARVSSAGSQPSRMLYVVRNDKAAKGGYRLTFDYVLTDPSDALGVTVFAMDKDLRVGASSGAIHMDKGMQAGMTKMPVSSRWKTGTLSVNLGDGYNYVYVLFAGTGMAGYTGVDNVFLMPE